MLGDPNCPHCHGVGYLRADVPIGHPDFGKAQVCTCRQGEVSQRNRERLFALSQLEELKGITFENFEPRGRRGIGRAQADSVEQAYDHARRYAETHDAWLLLHGGYGTGKTHLAAAIANFAAELGIPTLFLTVPDLLDSLRFTFGDSDTSYEERLDEIRRAPLLILDDFGTQNATAWAQEKLFQIINYRYINKLPMVITTNLALDDLEGRIRSRLLDTTRVTYVNIQAPDYRRRFDEPGHPELSSLDQHVRQTFDNFDLRKGEGILPDELRSLEKAFKGAQKFAKQPRGWLVFSAPHGDGKTHLAAAIANHQTSQGHPTLFIVVPDLLDHLRATFNPNSPVSYDQRFEDIRQAPLLILDDLGTQSTTPWAREKLYQLFNHRYNTELPTVITTSERLDDMDARLRSRMLDKRLCTIHEFDVPAYEGKPKKG
ncbi:MAG: ATP-binding protein [Verrucomicrobiales bacterium]|nr:ATP-binding protein [Verrucomicrobiales bacterium]